MTNLDPFEPLREQQEFEGERVRRLAQLAHQWNDTIRQSLHRLAQTLWPNGHVLVLIPLHRYRMRYRAGPDVHVWWVEHDVPPHDRYQCAAYRVLLTLDAHGEARLTVQSGTSVYPVIPLSVAALDAALAQAGQNPALTVPRAMGEATD